MLLVVAMADAASSATLSTLASFNGSNGSIPASPLALDAAGNLYGTTYQGGAHGGGTLFRLNVSAHQLETLTAFNFTNGGHPSGGLVADSAGNLYGTTQDGGLNSDGTIFRFDLSANQHTSLVSFDIATGYRPQGGLIAGPDGGLYGTTSRGGFFGGTVFRLDPITGSFAKLSSFNLRNGESPLGRLTADAAGNLYGTAYWGGAYDRGAVFRWSPETGEIALFASFKPMDGKNPFAGLVIGVDGSFYGTTHEGGTSNLGTIFRVNADSRELTTLASFDGVRGAYPRGALLSDVAGNLYGTTRTGGDYDKGTVFRLAAGTHELTTLVSFDGLNGSHPVSDLVVDANGRLYGTTAAGGEHDEGSIFRLADFGFVVPEPSTWTCVAIAVLPALSRTRRSLSSRG